VPNTQEYNDEDSNEMTEDSQPSKKDDSDDQVNFFDELNKQSGYPIFEWIIFIVAFLILALILGVICRCCCKKKRNRVNKRDQDFSFSEEERRANVIRAHALKDVAKRDESISRSSLPREWTRS